MLVGGLAFAAGRLDVNRASTAELQEQIKASALR
tara:strand:- start:500 stop:601 length:102 start_codon:yes stop_codon:yes gene_type:complete